MAGVLPSTATWVDATGAVVTDNTAVGQVVPPHPYPPFTWPTTAPNTWPTQPMPMLPPSGADPMTMLWLNGIEAKQLQTSFGIAALEGKLSSLADRVAMLEAANNDLVEENKLLHNKLNQMEFQNKVDGDAWQRDVEELREYQCSNEGIVQEMANRVVATINRVKESEQLVDGNLLRMGADLKENIREVKAVNYSLGQLVDGHRSLADIVSRGEEALSRLTTKLEKHIMYPPKEDGVLVKAMKLRAAKAKEKPSE